MMTSMLMLLLLMMMLMLHMVLMMMLLLMMIMMMMMIMTMLLRMLLLMRMMMQLLLLMMMVLMVMSAVWLLAVSPAGTHLHRPNCLGGQASIGGHPRSLRETTLRNRIQDHRVQTSELGAPLPPTATTLELAISLQALRRRAPKEAWPRGRLAGDAAAAADDDDDADDDADDDDDDEHDDADEAVL